jgi:hypothetical protein
VHLQPPDHLASIFSQIHEQKKREMNNKYIDCLHMVACPHQIILGYMFLLYPESVRDTIVYLATRYQRRPPKKVLYDNSCQAEKSGKLVSTLTALCTPCACSLCSPCNDHYVDCQNASPCSLCFLPVPCSAVRDSCLGRC